VTNIPLHLDRIAELNLPGRVVEFPTDQVKGEPHRIFDYVEAGAVFVLDEVWQLFPAGLKANHVPEPYKKLLAEHRHMVNEAGESTQIVLVTQDLAQISAFARQLVETTFRTMKLTVIGQHGRYRVDVFQGIVTGPNPNVAARIREIYGEYKPEVYRLYKSHTMSQSGTEGAQEKTVDSRANVLKRPSLILMMLAAPLMIGGGVWYLASGRLFNFAEETPNESPAALVEPQAFITPWRDESPAQARVVPAAAAWRVAAVVERVGLGRAAARVALTDGSRVVVVPFNGNCRDVPERRVVCRWEGVEATDDPIVEDGSPSAFRAPDDGIPSGV